MDLVRFDVEKSVGWLTLNQPETRNALSLEMMGAVQKVLDGLADDESVRALVIRGAGPAFCAGHNLREMIGEAADSRKLRRIFDVCTRMMETLHNLPQPVIAQVHGIATAAGCQLVAACDLAVAESEARFATPGVRIGLFCTTPMVPLCRVIGRRRALEMLLTGRFISAEEAERFGLVNRVVPMSRLAEETEALAGEIAGYSRYTVGFGKRAFYTQIDQAEGAAYGYAREAIALNALTEDAQEGMTAFLEKRPPRWRDR